MDVISYGKAKQAEQKANSVQTQLDQAVAEGDQLAETQQARVDTSGNPHSTLNARIESEVQKLSNKDNDLAAQLSNTNAQLAERAKQADLNIEKVRIDNLVAHAGDTEGNAELLDIRVGFDGVVYPTAGDAVRSIAVRSIDGFLIEDGHDWEVEE